MAVMLSLFCKFCVPSVLIAVVIIIFVMVVFVNIRFTTVTIIKSAVIIVPLWLLFHSLLISLRQE